MKKNMDKLYPIQELVAALRTQLLPCCQQPEGARQEAWWMLEKLTGKSKGILMGQTLVQLSDDERATLDLWISHRVLQNKPLQYILGTVPFCDLEIIVQPPILIPRPETEEWVTWLIDQYKVLKNHELAILDLCTGSGCIALALAKAFPKATVVGIDINHDAIELAQKNKRHNAIDNVHFIVSDLYQALDPLESFDLIVSNPPYLTDQEYQQLMPDVKLWEDEQALVADEQGLAIYKRIASQARSHLDTTSILRSYDLAQIVAELGMHPEAVSRIFKNNDFGNIRLHKDMQGVARWIAAHLT
jgi:release factor glutamine methyltransferase